MFATRITPLRAVVAAAALTAVLPATAAAASASSSSSTAPDTPVTRVADFIASPSALGSAGGLITLSAVVKNATSCVFSAQPAVSGLPATVACSSGTVQENVTLPANAATTPVKYTFGLAVTGSTTVTARPVKFVVSGDGTQKGFVSTASNYGGYCGLLSSGGVDCWGWNDYGTLGNGTSVSYSKVAQPVSGIGGAGVLTGAVSVVSDDNASTCAVLTSSGVACWGINDHGELGDGTTPYYSAVPTAVVGVGGTGTLSGVLSLTPVADTGYCALLTSGGVDCWGGNTDGQLGDGTMTGPDNCAQGACADTPVPVSGVGGTGQLSGVAGLAGNGGSGYCAVLSSGGVDCWGAGPDPSLVPVPVPGAGGVGVLSGVMSVVGDGIDLCALLTSGGVDCWGQNTYGELGNGTTTDGPYPGPVSGADGNGELASVASIISDDAYSFCAVLARGTADCWGNNDVGNLGDGTTVDSDVPAAVAGLGGRGTLTGVQGMTFDGGYPGYCALLTSTKADCWGDGTFGVLGDGSAANSSVPVAVAGVLGTGTLKAIANFSVGGSSYCAVTTTGQAHCWGLGGNGALGDGNTSSSSIPTTVIG